jgi:exopolysaccharide biosynthesis protein
MSHRQKPGKGSFALTFILCFAIGVAYGQTDSIALVSARWECTPLADNVVWMRYHFQHGELFESNQYVSIIKISPASGHLIFAIAYSDSLETTSSLARRSNAVAGINGSFFKMPGPDPDHVSEAHLASDKAPRKPEANRSVVYLRVSDSVIVENQPDNASLRKRHQQGVVEISGAKLSLLLAKPDDFSWESTLKGSDIITSGPMLLLAGRKIDVPNDAFCNNRHPRTAVAKEPDGAIIWLVVDGRSAQSYGMTIRELQNTLKWLGCTDAINLDGGGSSTLYVQGQPHDGVVNHPSDNRKFDHDGEREVANAIVLVPE